MWAMMFVTVACGAISGFHATQSPIMARCLTSEQEGRTVFYGAMVTEGIIALIWAAAGVTFYNGVGPLSDAIDALGQGGVVYEISTTLMGPVGGVLAMMVLWTGAVFLFRFGYPPVCCFMAALPATFMSAVSMTYILQAPEGFQLSTSIAYPVGVIFAAACLVLFVVQTYVRNRDSAGTAEVRA